MKDFDERRIGIMVSIAAILIAAIVALFLYPPYAYVKSVELDGDMPLSVERKAERLIGLSRFGKDYRKIVDDIRTSPYFQSADLDIMHGVLSISVEPSDSLVVITDGNGYILYGNGEVSVPLDEDVAFVRMHMPLVEVTSGQLEYIARFGIEKRLSEVIDLILEIYHSRSYNDKLVGKVKYQSGTGEEFGHLDFISASGDAVLHIREKADPEMVLKSLEVMKEKGNVLPTDMIREYELRGNTLTEQKRIVDGI